MSVNELPYGNELLLGFDARLTLDEQKRIWPASRKEEALIRVNAVAPLSVDYLVWPSAWPPDAPSPGWHGPVQGLWDSLEHMEEQLERMEGRWSKVAIVLEWNTVRATERLGWLQRTKEIRPTRTWESWQRLGYDVADPYLTSSSLWFRPGELATAVRAHWTGCLSELHLFREPGEAEAFQTYCDKRAPEHAPHFVYGILVNDKWPVSTKY